MSDKDFEELKRLREQSTQDRKEIQHLTKLIEDLQRQLQQALDGNKDLRELLKDLQSKIDVLITQTKKRNKRDYGKKTETHNPRPARLSSTATKEEKSTGIKHILDNARHLSHELVAHSVKSEESICPDCIVDTVFVSNLVTHQLEMVSASLKVLEHCQETRACPKCKQ